MKPTPVTEEKLQDILTIFRNEIFEKLDDISGQLETIREEQTIGYHQFKNLEERVNSHEQRITNLESSQS